MRAVMITVEPFQFLSILEVTSVKELNDHGTITISGLIDGKQEETYHNTFLKEAAICVKVADEDGAEQIFFQGVITGMSIHTEGQLHQMTIEAKTGSYLLDRTPHTRLFQDGSLDYDAVIGGPAREAGGYALMVERYEETIKRFIVQYKETDWAFAKRLANNLGMVLLAEFQREGKLFHVGIRDTQKEIEVSSDDYLLERSPEGEGVHSLIWSERGIYKVGSREIYHLGEYVRFKGSRWAVGKIESGLKGEELYHQYSLYSLKPHLEALLYNDRIQGVAMKGKVQKVEGTKVRLTIYEDENQDPGSRWFDYATVYSTPDGTGWYCMPEVGDEVRLVFPDEDEAKAYVAGSVHLDGGDGRDNPDIKFWKNKWEKEIRFTPKTLTLTNNAGLSLELSDQKGITITSNQGIYLNGDQNISISSGGGISVYGNDSVSVKQGASHIKVANEIDIVGGRINMN